MGDSKKSFRKYKAYYKYVVEEEYLLLTLFVFVLFLLFSGGFGLVKLIQKDISSQEKGGICGDGTLYENCSITKPYFCSEGMLIDLPSACGCPDKFSYRDGSCYSIYQTKPKEISLRYTIRGKIYSTDFIVYDGFKNYIYKVPRSIRSYPGENLSREDFKLKAMNEEEQRKFLMPLVIKIQNMTSNKDDQARIAISMVQNIPFGASNETFFFGNYNITHSRYPYEVLYDMKGVCGEKTDLLAFLLRELGYGTASFYYPLYNHESLGVRCPIKESLIESGYCFVETTGPSILTDNEINYVGIGKLYSNPEIYPLSDGISLGDKMYEYSDADSLIHIRNAVEKRGQINLFRSIKYEKLVEKYGLIREYYGE
jgi:hypothetical protein